MMVNFLTLFSIGAENWLVANPRDLNGLVDTLHPGVQPQHRAAAAVDRHRAARRERLPSRRWIWVS
jgi:hypothetical protein